MKRIMLVTLGVIAGFHGANLEAAEHVGALVEWRIVAGEGSADFRFGIIALVADLLYEQVDALLGGHLLQVEA